MAALLEPEDVARYGRHDHLYCTVLYCTVLYRFEQPDPLSVMTYVAQLYHALVPPTQAAAVRV